MLLLLQVLLFSALAIYFAQWRQEVRRRNRRTWDSLLASLRSEWSAHELSDQFLWKEGMNSTPDDTWHRMEGPKGLWVMYQNARVMLEIADFAASSNPNVDRAIIEELRKDALQIRLCALLGLSQYGLSQANEGARASMPIASPPLTPAWPPA
jgi:hypothetical protein